MTIKQEGEKIYYEVEFKERDYRTTPGDVLVNLYKYIHDIAQTHSSEAGVNIIFLAVNHIDRLELFCKVCRSH